MSDHQAAFTEMLRVGREMRKRIFDTLEQRHAEDFRSGRQGMQLYEDLLSAVRDARLPEAVEEFESRFQPLVNAGRLEMGDPDQMAAVEDRRGSGWDWISALCVAAVIVGALILGFNALKTTTAESPAVTEAPVPATKSTEEPAPETMTEPAPETVTAPAPATAPEQEPPSEH